MVDLGGLANYFNRVGGSFDYFSPLDSLELGFSSFVGEITSFINPTPFVSPFGYGLDAGAGIGRSFYGSLFSPTYEQSKWRAAVTIGTMGDAVFNTDRMIYGAQTATGGGAPFHFIPPMPVPYIPVSAPSNPDPSFFDRPMQRYDPPAASPAPSPTPPSAQPPPALDLPLTPPPDVPPAKKVGGKKGAPPVPKGGIKPLDKKNLPSDLTGKLGNSDQVYRPQDLFPKLKNLPQGIFVVKNGNDIFLVGPGDNYAKKHPFGTTEHPDVNEFQKALAAVAPQGQPQVKDPSDSQASGLGTVTWEAKKVVPVTDSDSLAFGQQNGGMPYFYGKDSKGSPVSLLVKSNGDAYPIRIRMAPGQQPTPVISPTKVGTVMNNMFVPLQSARQPLAEDAASSTSTQKVYKAPGGASVVIKGDKMYEVIGVNDDQTLQLSDKPRPETVIEESGKFYIQPSK